MCTIICNVKLLDSKIPSISGKFYTISELHNIARKDIIYGELRSNGGDFDTSIDVEKYSHKIQNFEVYNGSLYGDVVVLPSTSGKYLETFQIHSMNFTPQITGLVKEKNGIVSISNFDIIAFDCYLNVCEQREAA
jgi:hypothetical protein